MSHQMAKQCQCTGSGLLFMQLQLAFQRDGVHELHDVLCEEINNKPRVTKNKVLLLKKNAISNTNYLIYSCQYAFCNIFNIIFQVYNT